MLTNEYSNVSFLHQMAFPVSRPQSSFSGLY
jgi:hypothetical protein